MVEDGKVRAFEMARAMEDREDRDAVMSLGEARTVSTMPLGEGGAAAAAAAAAAAEVFEAAAVAVATAA